MKKTLILLAFCSLPAMAFSQNGGAAAQATVASDGQVHDKVEQPPRFPGGYEALERWKEQHIVYPEEAIERGAQGQVVVRFVILNTGEVADAEILRSIDPALDKEALRLVSSMPKWTPGITGHARRQCGERKMGRAGDVHTAYRRRNSRDGTQKERKRTTSI